jgi:GNAT superfamily N-acetyltransferase
VTPAIAFETAGALGAAQVLDFYADMAGVPRPTAWRPAGPCEEFGQAALIDGALVGLLAGSLKAANDRPEERLLHLYGGVQAGWRQRGIGRRLIEALAGACRDTSRRVTAIVNLTQDQAAVAAPFLTKMGFAEVAGSARYARDLAHAAPPPPASGVQCYRGGDPALDAAIVDLYRSAYRGRPNVPELTVDDLREQFADPSLVYFLVFDGDRLVGHASAQRSKRDCFVDTIQVARSHWGTGAADSLALAITRHALETGAARITGAADATNRANRALMERHGLRVTEFTRRYCRIVDRGDVHPAVDKPVPARPPMGIGPSFSAPVS